MNNNDYREVIDQEENEAAGQDFGTPEETNVSVEETPASDKEENEYEDICYICRRPEHIAGKMIKIPNNISICRDCMQKTFDSMNGSGFSMDDMFQMNMGKMPNISMINLSDLQGFVPNNQKIKQRIRKT